MSKKVKTLIAFGIAAVVLIGAFLALYFLLPEQEEQSVLYDGELYTIFDESDNELETITVDYAGDHYVIEELTAYHYGIAEIEDYIDTIDFNNTYMASYSLATYNKIETDGSNLADYGLNAPQATVTFSFADGAVHVLLVGNSNSAQNGYYVKLKDSSEVYVLQSQSVERYLKTSNSFVNTTVVEGFDTSDDTAYPVFAYFEIERKDLEKNIYIRPMTSAEKKSETATTAIMKMTSPVNALVLNDAVQDDIYGFFGLEAESCATYRYTDEQAAEYGFDDPTGIVRTKFDNTEMTLTVGAFANEEKTQYYVQSSKNPKLVYVVAAENITWIDLTADQIVSPVAVQPYILDLSTITLQLNQGKIYEFKLTHEKGENDKNVTTVTCNGEAVDGDNFKRYLQLLLYTSGETIYYGEPVDEANEVLEINYEYNNGAEPDVVKIIKNTARYGIMEVNGYQNFTARLAYIDKLQTELDKLFAGEKIDTEW